VTEKNGG
jgi:hypothetical protein